MHLCDQGHSVFTGRLKPQPQRHQVRLRGLKFQSAPQSDLGTPAAGPQGTALMAVCDTKSQEGLSDVINHGADLLFHQQYPMEYGGKATNRLRAS